MLFEVLILVFQSYLGLLLHISENTISCTSFFVFYLHAYVYSFFSLFYYFIIIFAGLAVTPPQGPRRATALLAEVAAYKIMYNDDNNS